jgi:type IV pilus assembly protein PilE
MIKKVMTDESGFSLTEILVVLVIIGILVLLALPKFSAVITRAKTTEAKTMLRHLHVLQQSYYYEHDHFSRDLESIGFEQINLISAGGEARYRIEIVEANINEYVARATAVVDFDKDGIFNIWEVDQTGKIRQTIVD